MKNYIFVDYRISNEEYTNLRKHCSNIIKLPPCNLLYPAIEGHPDILMHILSETEVIVHNNMDVKFIDFLRSIGFTVILSKKSLQSDYPHDIFLNAVSMKNLFIHNIKFSDDILLEYTLKKSYKNRNFKIIDVSQGYTKCSLAVLNENCFITSDTLLYKNLLKNNFSVLYVPAGDILLPGLDYGFIGGCCGTVDNNTVAFYGNLNYYKYGKEVLDFLYLCNIKPVYLYNGKLIDRGSIFSI